MTDIDCPRAKSGMTPCVARDGHTALADNRLCVGCGASPAYEAGLLVARWTPPAELQAEIHRVRSRKSDASEYADLFTKLVAAYVENEADV